MPDSNFLVVGIAASAGGIKACREFFRNVSEHSGAAYLVILHLPPEHESALANVLQTVSRIPVSQVTERTRIQPNRVYLIPPNSGLEMRDGFVIPTSDVEMEERRATVDTFFCTLAESHHSRAVAVVLSGRGASGSSGIKRVKEHGGICLAQNPAEAEVAEMPRHAIGTRLVDDVLSVVEMPMRIARYRDTIAGLERPEESPGLGELLVKREEHAHTDAIENPINSTGKRIEDELRLSQGRFRSVMEAVAQHAIITMDVNGTIESWNSGAEVMFGFSAKEAIGQPASLIFTPEDRQAGVPEKEIDSARREGRAFDERWHQRKDGGRIFVSGVLSPIGGADVKGYVKVARDLTERKEWEDALQKAYADLERRVEDRTRELAVANEALEQELTERRVAEENVRRLLARLITVQEEERRRIARDLHDHLGQQMTALHLRLEALRQKPDDWGAWERRFKDTQSFVLQLDRDLDFFTWELRPAALYDLGLSSALHDYVHSWAQTFNITAEFHDMTAPGQRFTSDLETNLHRIAQEALNNVHKHAQASTVDIRLRVRGPDVVLTIEDDGIGFDPDEPRMATSIGLIGMRERAALMGGRLEIESARGKGTAVIVTVPAAYAAS